LRILHRQDENSTKVRKIQQLPLTEQLAETFDI